MTEEDADQKGACENDYQRIVLAMQSRSVLHDDQRACKLFVSHLGAILLYGGTHVCGFVVLHKLGEHYELSEDSASALQLALTR